MATVRIAASRASVDVLGAVGSAGRTVTTTMATLETFGNAAHTYAKGVTERTAASQKAQTIEHRAIVNRQAAERIFDFEDQLSKKLDTEERNDRYNTILELFD